MYYDSAPGIVYYKGLLLTSQSVVHPKYYTVAQTETTKEKKFEKHTLAQVLHLQTGLKATFHIAPLAPMFIPI